MSERLRTYKNKGRDLAVSGHSHLATVCGTCMTYGTVTVAWFNTPWFRGCVYTVMLLQCTVFLGDKLSPDEAVCFSPDYPTTMCRTCGTEGQRSQWSYER